MSLGSQVGAGVQGIGVTTALAVLRIGRGKMSQNQQVGKLHRGGAMRGGAMAGVMEKFNAEMAGTVEVKEMHNEMEVEDQPAPCLLAQ